MLNFWHVYKLNNAFQDWWFDNNQKHKVVNQITSKKKNNNAKDHENIYYSFNGKPSTQNSCSWPSHTVPKLHVQQTYHINS